MRKSWLRQHVTNEQQNHKLAASSTDKNYLIRRARLVFQGDIGNRLSFYIQPDFASSAGTTGNVANRRIPVIEQKYDAMIMSPPLVTMRQLDA